MSAKEGPRSIPFRSMSVAEYPPVSVGDLVSYLEAIDARDNEAYALNVSFLKKVSFLSRNSKRHLLLSPCSC